MNAGKMSYLAATSDCLKYYFYISDTFLLKLRNNGVYMDALFENKRDMR